MRENVHHKIKGAYQYEAIHEGICFQKSWHLLKYEKALKLLDLNEDDAVLDAACGSGVMTNFIAQKKPGSLIGVDFSEAAINFCRQQYVHQRIVFLKRDLKERDFEENSFSKIVMLETIEHLTESAAISILKNLHFYLKPGGSLVTSTPNKHSLWPAIEFILDSLKLTPPMKNEQHVKLYTRKSLQHILELCGFKVKSIETSHFIAPWFSFLGLKSAEKIHKIEEKIGLLPGSLLFIVAEK